MRVGLRHRQHHLVVELRPEGQTHLVTVDGVQHVVELQALDQVTRLLVVDGRTYRVEVARNGRDLLVGVGGEVYTFAAEGAAAAAHEVATVAAPEITAPMPGKVLEVLVQPGDHVDAGDGLLILEAMKMENRLVAEVAATVNEVRVAAGDMVDGGQVLMVLAYDTPSAGAQ